MWQTAYPTLFPKPSNIISILTNDIIINQNPILFFRVIILLFASPIQQCI